MHPFNHMIDLRDTNLLLIYNFCTVVHPLSRDRRDQRITAILQYILKNFNNAKIIKLFI